MADREINPFSPPQADDDGPIRPLAGRAFFAAQDGRDLRFDKSAALPHVCIKCAASDRIGWRAERFYYHPPWVYLFIVLNLLVFAIIALSVRKKADLRLPICAACAAAWKKGKWIAGLSVLPGTSIQPEP